MAKPRMKRWVCPDCGSGCLAPSRPRKDDVRRFCLKCSAATGRLVPRVCPSVEATRVSAEESRRRAAEKRREREVEREHKRWTAAGIDVREEMRRLCSMPCVQEELQRRGLGKQGRRVLMPALTIHRTQKEHVTGRAWWKDVHLSVPLETTSAEVKSLLAHELAHIAVSRGAHHREPWRRMFVLLAAQAYGIDPVTAQATRGSSHDLHDRVTALILAAEGCPAGEYRVGAIELTIEEVA